MTSLNTEQLTELTKLVNERLGEWEFPHNYSGIFDCLPKGVVRLVAEVFVEWQAETENAFYDALTGNTPPKEPEEGSNGVPSPSRGHIQRKPLPPLPDPDVARERIAQALARAGGGELASILIKPRTPEEIASMDDDFDFDDDDLPNVNGRPTVLAKASRRPHHEKAGRNGNVLPTLDDIIAELRRLSMGTGVMPTMSTFDAARPGNWATAGAHMQRLGVTWNDLVEAAELRPRQPGKQPDA